MTTHDDVRARLRESCGDELVERIDHLDATRDAVSDRGARDANRPAAPDRDAHLDFDVAIAGGGLWSILAPLLAARGLRVAVLERTRAGAAHREWNASRSELERLVDAGLVGRDELDALVVARYSHGTCAFHAGGSYPVRGVLDHAVDAGALLAHARRRGEHAGVAYLDGHVVTSEVASAHAVRIHARRTSGAAVVLHAKVLVDARGASSPYAAADLVCPTVGGVLRGLEEGSDPGAIDPNVGEILATVDPIEEGRQHVWEAFPGRHHETTVYLFHYARSTDPVSLMTLYARFFDTLPRYKRGDAKLVRPTFGFIPGWSRLTEAPRSPSARILLVGDAAARHSPLTYCGFGSMLRSLRETADAIERCASSDRVLPLQAIDEQPIHSLTGALAHLLASPAFVRNELNALLDAAFGTLAAMGNEPYASLLRDEMDGRSFVRFLRAMSIGHPEVWSSARRGLGLKNAGRWGFEIARSLVHRARG